MAAAVSEAVAERLRRWTGLDLGRGGRMDALARLVDERTRMVGAPSAEAYLARLDGPDHPEVAWIVNAVTVGHTWFFRDAEQVAAIGNVLKNHLAKESSPVRIWVAGCSTGEEAYTMAMLAASLHVTVEILATDINSKALERAQAAEYSAWSVRDVPPEVSSMLRVAASGRTTVDARVRQQVTFQRHNLVDRAPKPRSGGDWHAVICRNVLIYFHRDEAQATAHRLAQALAVGGWLILGAGEIVDRAPPGFELAPMGGPSARYGLRRTQSTVTGAVSSRIHIAPAPAPQGRSEGASAKPGAGDPLEEALGLIERGRSAEAIPLCALVLQKDPLSAQAYLVSGIAFYMNDDPRSAAHALRSALLLDPDEWIASFYLALAYEKVGRDVDARREYAHVAQASRRRSTRSGLAVLEAFRDEILAVARGRSFWRFGS